MKAVDSDNSAAAHRESLMSAIVMVWVKARGEVGSKVGLFGLGAAVLIPMVESSARAATEIDDKKII